MSQLLIITISIGYLVIIFTAAYLSERSKSLKTKIRDSSLVYALSLGVYCTAWTFYGSVGQAASNGLGFLGVYLGPTLIAPLLLFVLKKMIRISRHLRITSIADFISSRYGKSTALGVLVSLLCLLIVIPYISIQLKALEFSYNFLKNGLIPSGQSMNTQVFYKDPTIFFVLIFAAFAVFFGTRKLDPSEKHPGLVSVIALESLIKLICFLIGAFVIIYLVFNGLGDIFGTFHQKFDISDFAIISDNSFDYQSWFWILILSAAAFLLLPRQFHMAVVENNSVRHIKKASWIVPIYMLLISLLVIPVAFAGKILLGNTVEVDTYLLSIPTDQGLSVIALIVYIGGLAAISGMIITSLTALSIMISNNIFLPLLLRGKKHIDSFFDDLNTRLLQLRRLLIFVVVVLSYAFYKGVSINYSLVSVGLMSFAGIAQIAPMLLLGLYWKQTTAKGAISGFTVGVIIWAFTLPFANMAELGIISSSIMSEGLFNIKWLRPTALFGIEGMSAIAHGSFWSLSANLLLVCVVSLYTRRTALEIAQSDIFLNPEKYYRVKEKNNSAFEREAVYHDLKTTLNDILGDKKVDRLLKNYFLENNILEEPILADSSLIAYIENHLSGSIGTSSANIVLNSLVQQKPVDTKELIKLLDQTYQVYEYTQELESKSRQLNKTTNELREANQQLKQLDVLKNEFISNVTHELRTPITSIRSLSNILCNYNVTEEEKIKFLSIISEESERISVLINQVLDLRKENANPLLDLSYFDLSQLIHKVVDGFTPLKENRNINVKNCSIEMYTDKNKLQQILVNLISNAIKFTDKSHGEIILDSYLENQKIRINVIDNGIGISTENQKNVFDRFYQTERSNLTKSKGSGLGLSISKELSQSLGGEIIINSNLQEGSTFSLIIPQAKKQ